MKGAQHEQKVEKVRLAIKFDPKTKPPQVHVPKKKTLFKVLLSPWTKIVKNMS
jgi:hypothetical protein